MTTGGSDYHVVNAAEENSYWYYDGADLDGEDIQHFKNGTTPIFTFFYNEPWNVDSNGPAPFLAEPELHLHCLRTLPSTSEEYESSSPRIQARALYLWPLALFLCSLIWI